MPYWIRKNFGPTACSFIEDIIDGMQDWVRVINKEDTVIFVNKSMREALGTNIVGQKCYHALGRTTPCENCISRDCLSDWSKCKEEVINGRTFIVTSSPLNINKTEAQEGLVDGIIEVLHDITELKEMSSALKRQNDVLKEDFAIAKSLQFSLLPQKPTMHNKIDFDFIYKPCQALGGDFIDIFEIDTDHIGLYIADVSGHGVAAAMLTMFLRAALDKSSVSPSKALTKLYYNFKKNGFSDELYISVFYCIIDTRNNSITYTNAGLNVCPILYHANRIQFLRAAGIPISNWVEEPDYNEQTLSLSTDDRIFFCTDGIIEIKNSAGEQFGEERVVDHLLYSEEAPSQVLSKLVDKALSFSDDSTENSVTDDITVALLKIK